MISFKQDRTALLFLFFPSLLLVLRGWVWHGCLPTFPVQLYQVFFFPPKIALALSNWMFRYMMNSIVYKFSSLLLGNRDCGANILWLSDKHNCLYLLGNQYSGLAPFLCASFWYPLAFFHLNSLFCLTYILASLFCEMSFSPFHFHVIFEILFSWHF